MVIELAWWPIARFTLSILLSLGSKLKFLNNRSDRIIEIPVRQTIAITWAKQLNDEYNVCMLRHCPKSVLSESDPIPNHRKIQQSGKDFEAEPCRVLGII